MNRGTPPGLTATTWRSYKPKLVTVNGNADQSGLTQPFLDPYDGRFQFGRYMVLDGLIRVQIQLAFVGSSTVGAGTAYVVSLPVPARRTTPGAASLLPLGTTMCYWSGAEPFVNVPCCATLADPWASLSGTEDNYFQMYATQATAWGSVSGWTTTTPTTVTHNLGFAPPANAITLTVGGTSANVAWPYYVDTITTTTFKIHTWNDANASSGGTVGWKVIAEPPTGQGSNLVGPFMPFDWSRFTGLGPFGNIFVELSYEPAR